ncbi:MarR family winged helix-turn-helix transcriptional regulator [Sorangium sp. So ce1078]|uniref:MarR family winged helix-turn-helix transcriptional regulator n=1 Tax=Sorangium sp. So ce1078 TaxID=3133329 RepID=UPI003F60C354
MAVTDLQNASEMVGSAAADRFGLNRTDARCVAYLMTRGPMSIGELGEASGLTAAALTFVVDRLEQAGYVQRARDPDDRRRVRVEPTDQARQVAEEFWGEISREAQAKLSGYTLEQLRLLIDFIRGQVDLQRRQAARLGDAASDSAVVIGRKRGQRR